MQKTIVVQTVTRVPHAKFGKIIKQRRKFYAHDEEGRANVGDVVRIIECRPMSKLKRWRLGEVMRKAVQVTTDLSSIGIQPGREERASVKKKKKGK
jgi:small subunit ribosomal protein S17